MTSGLADEYLSSSTKSTDNLNYKENLSTNPNRSNVSRKSAISFIRSASSTQIVSYSEPDPAPSDNPLRRALSENVLIDSSGNVGDRPYRRKANNLVQAQGAGKGGERNTQANSLGSGPKVTVSRFSLDPPGAEDEEQEEQGEDERRLNLHGLRRSPPPVQGNRVPFIPRSVSRLARRSWVSRSRSVPPSTLVANLQDEGEAPSSISKSSSSSTLKSLTGSTKHDKSSKARRRRLSALLGKAPSDSNVPSVPAIPTSFSTDKLPFIRNQASGQTPSFRRLTSWELSQSIGYDSSRKRDELSSAFRTLDGEFQKFQSRTSSLKTAVVRSTLLPFMKAHANHPSNATLRPEDLDRRVNTLDKWWTGLLTMLVGRNGEIVSGSDRPTILDAVTSIMVRPEWILSYQAAFAPSDGNGRPFLKSRSTTSLISQSSDFLAESISHNVRRIYAEKLICQMAYVVEKMSSRSVPASVVTFCGKAIAHAFFYCGGVAQMLVRLWAIPQEMIRRVMAEHRLTRDVDLGSSMNFVVRNFPSTLHDLGFKSLKATARYLRSRPRFPNGAARINWYGPWVQRWAGRDTDLLFIFTRNYYNLMSEHLPSDLMPQGRLCAPGHILLQAQLLSVLDSVLSRNDIHSLPEPALEPSVVHSGMYGEADASATVLPLSPVATSRSMAESRVIILMRDYLSGPCPHSDEPKEIFATSFEYLMKAAARRVSVFNHNACFTLCDFMEEAMPILHRYSTQSSTSYTTPDWPFWLGVCRQMMESQNTMTQLRVYAFLYSLWGTITAEENRKHQVCLEWLLDEGYFYAQFNHWCPMVRAYYMRILCWRLGRICDWSSDLDASILTTLATRLDYVWSTFRCLQDTACSKGGPQLSTAPCSPAPSRQLLVVRNDSQPASGGMFLTFDSILSLPSSTQSTSDDRHSSLNASMDSKEPSTTKNPGSMGRRSWSMLKNMMPFTALADPPASSDQSRTAKLKRSEPQSPDPTSAHSSKHAESPKSHLFQPHSFKFSLEWIGDETSPFGKERQLQRPQLPGTPPNWLERPNIDTLELKPSQAQGAAVNVGKYAGRALAEWDLVLAEFKVFSERRRTEGVPNQTQIETPTLGVETFRRPG